MAYCSSPILSDQHFSTNTTQCKYKTVEPSHKSHPSSTNDRDSKHIKSQPTKYLKYSTTTNDKFASNSALNLNNELPENVSIFPYNIYGKNPFANKSPSLNGPRDNNLLYVYAPEEEKVADKSSILTSERNSHTITASRFGYDRFSAFEYGSGPQSRGYVEPSYCNECANDIPPNMAPLKFYTEHHLKNTPTELRKINRI